MTPKGHIIWSSKLFSSDFIFQTVLIIYGLVLVCIYWVLGKEFSCLRFSFYLSSFYAAFIVGSAIPQVQTITGLIAAIAIMQFTYSFPPLLRLGYDVITDAMAADGAYVPGAGASGRVDTWRDMSRWKRVSP